jgi:DNA-binding LytR/AlgR family response regulator
MQPFKPPDILSAVGIALQSFEAKQNATTNDGVSVAEPAIMKMQNFVFIKDDYAFVKLPLNEVKFVKSDNNYLEIHTPNKTHVVRSTLKDFGVILPPDKFVQVHRSYIVNVEMIDKIFANQLLIGKDEVAISSKYKDQLMQRIVFMK